RAGAAQPEAGTAARESRKDHRCPKKTLRLAGPGGAERDRWRAELMAGAEQLGSEVGTAGACAALSVPRSSLYRRRQERPAAQEPKSRSSARALSPEE